MEDNNKKIATDFIDQIWNNRKFEKLDKFLHPDYKDHSLPIGLSEDKEGLKKWIIATGLSFEHKTFIEEIVSEEEKVLIKLRMELKHIGTWRNIEATGENIKVSGYRFYKILEGKIIEHHALIDGQTIENNLNKVRHACSI